MPVAVTQQSAASASNSDPSIKFDQFVERFYPYRVPLLIASLIVSVVLLFLEAPFGDYHIHALSHKLAFSGQSPFPTIHSWNTSQCQLTQLEIWIDSGFVFLYGLTLITWCHFFAHKSLFVVDKEGNLNTPTARLMKRLGMTLALLVVAGMVADLIENTVMTTWLYMRWSSIPVWFRWLWCSLISIKLFPPIAAIWYILLHPVSIVYSLIELLPGRRVSFSTKRDDLQTHAKNQQAYMAEVKQEASRELIESSRDLESLPGGPDEPDNPQPQKRRFWWLLTVWNSVLGVQFLLYLLLFMSIVVNLDQFDEVFFLWLSSTGNWQIVGTISLLILTLVCLGAMLYVTSKILLYLNPTKGLEPAGQPTEDNPAQTAATALNTHSSEFSFVKAVPLGFVALPFVVTLVAFLTSYSDLPTTERGESAHVLRFVMLIAVLLVSGWITVYSFYQKHRADEETEMLLFRSTTPVRDYVLLIRLIPGSMLFGQGLLNVLLLIFIPATGLFVAKWIGLHAVLLLWLCAVAYLGTLLIQFNKLPLYPLILGVVVYVVIASMFNDNSTIRQTPDTSGLVDKRPGFDHYFDMWYRQRDTAIIKTEIPVVIIASEGGGIRAAGWTTACLHQLDSLIPGFTRYVFGISGVSGGGVGAATYIALQRANATRADSLHRLPPLVGSMAEDVVSHDLIAPTVASMLFRGGVHNFSPAPIKSLDRNRWLEDAWEKATFDHVPDANVTVRRRLEQSFLQYCDSPADSTRFPLLFLNSSVAETGQKAILSPLSLENPPLPPDNQQSKKSHFYDVVDLFAVTKADIPFKTATFLCARFPFVTSGGRAEGQLPNMKSACKPTFHLIDGGYIENTGIMTGVQIIRRLQQITRLDTIHHYKVHYYLISLHNGQATDNATSKSTFRFLSEPLTGFLNAAGRQGFALDQLVAYTLKKPTDSTDVPKPNELQFTYINISLDRSSKGHQYPLGWYLSPLAARSLNVAAQKQVSDMANKQLAPLKNYIIHRPRMIPATH